MVDPKLQILALIRGGGGGVSMNFTVSHFTIIQQEDDGDAMGTIQVLCHKTKILNQTAVLLSFGWFWYSTPLTRKKLSQPTRNILKFIKSLKF